MESTATDAQGRLQAAAALLNASTIELLGRPDALDHASDLLDLHLAEGQVRQRLDADHQDVPVLLVTDAPAVLLREVTDLLDALPAAEQAPLHEARMLLERATGWTGAL